MSGQTEKAWERFFSRDFFILFSRPLGQTEKNMACFTFFSVYSIRRTPLGWPDGFCFGSVWFFHLDFPFTSFHFFTLFLLTPEGWPDGVFGPIFFFHSDFFILFTGPLGQTEKTWHVFSCFTFFSLQAVS